MYKINGFLIDYWSQYFILGIDLILKCFVKVLACLG